MNWKQLLNFEQGEVMGLDIGSSAVKVVTLRRDDSGYILTAAGLTEIAADRSEKSLVKAIRDCYVLTRIRSKKRLRTKLAVCGVSGPEVAVRDFEFSAMADEDLDSAVCLEAAQVCPFNAEQAGVDYQLIPNGDQNRRGVLVAATNMLMANKIELVRGAGLKCVLMDVNGLALLNCLHSLVGQQDRTGTAILNVGGSCTTLAIMSEEGWPFIRDTHYAGDEIIRQMTAEKNIPQETLRSMLFDDSADVSIDLGQSLEQACAELIADVSETLRFYATQKKSIPVKTILVCGGFAPARDFVALLSRRLGTNVLLWNPLDSMRCEAPGKSTQMYQKIGPAMAVAAGLAMRTIGDRTHE